MNDVKQGCQKLYFPYPQSQFGHILEGLRTENIGMFYGPLEYLTALGIFHGHLVYFVEICLYFRVLVCFTENNLATLNLSRHFHDLI
jgi:hypothetical protein